MHSLRKFKFGDHSLGRRALAVILTLVACPAIARDLGRTGPFSDTTWNAAQVVFEPTRVGMMTIVESEGARVASFELETDGFDVYARIGHSDELALFVAELVASGPREPSPKEQSTRSFTNVNIVIDGVPYLIRRGTIWVERSSNNHANVQAHIKGLARAQLKSNDPDLTVVLELMLQISPKLEVAGF